MQGQYLHWSEISSDQLTLMQRQYLEGDLLRPRTVLLQADAVARPTKQLASSDEVAVLSSLVVES